jgi:serine phosphatase RsbU (regulator of sigma subunit)
MKNLLLFVHLVLFLNPRWSLGQDEYARNGRKLEIADYIQLAEQKQKEGDERAASHFLNQAATIHWERKEYDEAIGYYQKSIELNEIVKNQQGILGIQSNLAMIHADKREFDQSLTFFEKVLDGRRKGKDRVSLISSLINTSVVLNNLNRHAEAAQRLEEAMLYARERNDAEQMRSCYGLLAETYEKAGDNKRSHENYELYRTFNDMISKDKEEKVKLTVEESRLRAVALELENKNKELELRLKDNELVKKEKTITTMSSAQEELMESMSKQDIIIKLLAKEKEMKDWQYQEEQTRHAAQQRQNWLIISFFVVGFALLSALLFVVWRNGHHRKKTNRQLRQHNQEIEEQQHKLRGAYTLITSKNQQITDSINYALRIQTAMLNKKDDLQKLLPDSFIFFRPKDIISGDFYWFGKKNEKIVVAAVDCTGHGVPGALMSMIANELLNKIVLTFNITSPEFVLLELHKDIQITLRQQDTENRDGMDMAMYVVNKEDKQLEFAGAKNPLVYIRENELVQLKAARRGLGGIDHDFGDERVFSKQIIPLDKPIYAYIFSDGYQDQFGGEKGKKFMIKRMNEMFLSNHQKPMAEQQRLISEQIDNWMGSEEQIDDMLVIGARIDINSL